jgi:hypothetical protein
MAGSAGHEFGLKSMASSQVPIPNGPEKSKKALLLIAKPSRGKRLGLKGCC